MNILVELPKMFELVRQAPPAPMFFRAFGRFVADLIIGEAIAVGPSPQYYAGMRDAYAFSPDTAKAIYELTLRDAIGRTMLTEPRELSDLAVTAEALHAV